MHKVFIGLIILVLSVAAVSDSAAAAAEASSSSACAGSAKQVVLKHGVTVLDNMANHLRMPVVFSSEPQPVII